MAIPAATIEQRLEVERLEVSAIIDTAEQALAQHVLQCKAAATRGEKGSALELNRALRELDSYRKYRDSGSDGGSEYFATPAQALPFLQKGFLIHKTKFYKDVADGRVPRKDGVFRADDLLYYARAAGLKPASSPDKSEESPLVNSKEDIQRETARRLKMQNDEREGRLIDAAEEEARDAKLWAAVKTDIERHAPGIVGDVINRILPIIEDDDLKQRILGLNHELSLAYEGAVSDIFDRYASDGGIES